ncbi:hypothetical protein EDC96DRAFT_581448 [Choanephora cucurbitarum]|nr:hypothetical protein EDC96DRAFT_581448 [Choanephora cucurbitarum]
MEEVDTSAPVHSIAVRQQFDWTPPEELAEMLNLKQSPFEAQYLLTGVLRPLDILGYEIYSANIADTDAQRFLQMIHDVRSLLLNVSYTLNHHRNNIALRSFDQSFALPSQSSDTRYTKPLKDFNASIAQQTATEKSLKEARNLSQNKDLRQAPVNWHPKSSLSTETDLVGGRLQQFATAWIQLFPNHHLLYAVQHGFKIPFHTSLPVQYAPSNYHVYTAPPGNPHSDLDIALLDLLKKKAIELVPHTDLHQSFISPIFTVPKKTGGAERLSSLHRPIRCLPPSTASPGIPQVPSLSLAKPIVPISHYAIRPQHCSLLVYKDHTTDCGMGQTAGDQDSSLSRRLDYNGRIEGNNPSAHSQSLVLFAKSGLVGQLGEIEPPPSSIVRTSGVSIGHGRYAGLLTWKEASQHTTSSSPTTAPPNPITAESS